MIIYSDLTVGMTEFRLQHDGGGSWANSSQLQHNQKYRFRAYFKNFAPATMMPPPIYVTELWVTLKLAGAKFTSSGRDDNRELLMGGFQRDGHSDFNDCLPPQQGRWFNFGEFTWLLASAAVSQHPLEIYSIHREIRMGPKAPWARLLPT